MPDVTVTLSQGALDRLLSPGGAIYEDMGVRARRVEAQSKVLAPVDTGRMRASGFSEPSSEIRGAWDVVYPVNYALWVNNGTRFMLGQPFLTDALPAAL